MCGSCYSDLIVSVNFPSLHMLLLAKHTYLNGESICTGLILCYIDCLLAGSHTSDPILSCKSWKTGIDCQILLSVVCQFSFPDFYYWQIRIC